MLGLAVLFFMLLGQHYLPLNPQQLPGLSWDLALNTAVSFHEYQLAILQR